ncbi:unnamed protein product [Rhizoctonia solani]|uniref:Alphaherpesvirus glycoprotein E domain protein n=1 Tax=Rhizoctonia solani TaxID=456999 RepID=A0A8H3DY76_9AGAM|nr:unnamed protein product [Rhizoctonia solani]
MRKHFSALLALGAPCWAWRANFSDATQCGIVTVTWSAATTESIGPPFVIRVAAFGLAPLVFNLPSSSWSAVSRAGSYSFTMPWSEGTQFLSVMDDGFGMGTGGVSGIQTVKSSSNSTCINSIIMQPRQTFDVASSFVQCSQVNMNWTEAATSETRITGLIPNGVSFQLDPPLIASKSTTWDLNIEAGTTFVLSYHDGPNSLSTPLLKSLDGPNTQCFASGVYPSATLTQTGADLVTSTSIPSGTATPTPISESGSSNRSNLGPILGAVLGALALLGAIGVGVWIALRRRRRKRMVPQNPEFAKEVDLHSGNVQPGSQPGRNHPNSRHPESAAVLPFVLPYSGSYQQDNTSRKHPIRDISGDTVGTSDSSHVYMTGTSVSQSIPAPRSDFDEEPMIIRHEDGGAIPPPRTREVIELPPGYDQLPRPLPPTPMHQQERPRPLPSQKSAGSNRL